MSFNNHSRIHTTQQDIYRNILSGRMALQLQPPEAMAEMQSQETLSQAGWQERGGQNTLKSTKPEKMVIAK